MPTFLLNPVWKKGREELGKGLGGAEDTLVSVSFFGTGAWADCFPEVEVSGLGALTPLTPSIPSTVTVLPSGSFSTFCSFFPIRGRLEQEVKRKRAIVKRLDNTKIF